MSLRHLDSLFRPKSVTVVGASNRPRSIGAVVMRNLLSGGLAGPILPLNPKYKAVAGVLAYPSVQDLPLAPDLAIICTPPSTVPDFVQELGQKGTKTVLIMSTDLDRIQDQQGESLYQRVLRTAREYSMRILGPNCLGVIIPRSGLNASFGHTNILQGKIAFVSQSDSLGIAVLDWASSKGIGFSHFISLGDCADIDFADVIDYLGGDPHSSSILLYIESIQNARKFISAARSASRNKPLVVIKSGGLNEPRSRTALPEDDPVPTDDIYDGIFRRAGMLRVFDVAELFDAVETMAKYKPLRGDRLAILSNGGGPAMMAWDILDTQGGRMASLSEQTLQDLQQALQDEFFGQNPVRVIDHASSEIYAQALEILLKDQEVDAVMVIHVPTAFASSEDIAGAVVNTIGKSRKNVITVWLGESDAAQARRIFALAGIPTYETPDQAARLFMDMVRYRRNQELLMETPASVPKEFTPNPNAARAIVRQALEENRELLNPAETNEILSIYAIPVVATRLAADAEESSLIARELGFPVALKLASPDIRDRLNAGAVALDLETPQDILKAARAMLARVIKSYPEARINGFILQRMARRPAAYELKAGIGLDPDFGPVLVFGQGGAAGQAYKDLAVGLPPLNMTLAKELIQHTRASKLLQGYGSRPAVDQEALRLTLVQLSQLVIDLPEIQGVNINPMLADSQGVLVLDAQIKISAARVTGPERLSIRPYPEHLEETAELASGLKVLLRPIRPEDEHMHLNFINKLSHEDLRLRFFGFVHEFSHSQLAQLTQIDYDREMAFIGCLLENGTQKETVGVVRCFFDPDNISAEFAIVVRTDLKTKGLGSLLMGKMISYCKQRGTKELTAYTLRENSAMKALGKKFGFRVETDPEDAETIILRLDLTEEG
ncbi:MAG: bifunctional acetate--CoA ligase family protein/GNAT family N-acetyltransferase [Desulfohalobiaceae bacterium]